MASNYFMPMIHQGVYLRNGSPYFIVEDYLMPANYEQIPLVAVFAIDKKSLGTYKQTKDVQLLRKETITLTIEEQPYGKLPKSKLAKIASEGDKDKHTLTKTYLKKPIFTSLQTVVEDTFTNDYGIGFYEYSPTIRVNNGAISSIKFGQPTGVKIALSSVTWIKYYTPTGSLKDTLYQDGQDYLNFINSEDSMFDMKQGYYDL